MANIALIIVLASGVINVPGFADLQTCAQAGKDYLASIPTEKVASAACIGTDGTTSILVASGRECKHIGSHSTATLFCNTIGCYPNDTRTTTESISARDLRQALPENKSAPIRCDVGGSRQFPSECFRQ